MAISMLSRALMYTRTWCPHEENFGHKLQCTAVDVDMDPFNPLYGPL